MGCRWPPHSCPGVPGHQRALPTQGEGGGRDRHPGQGGRGEQSPSEQVCGQAACVTRCHQPRDLGLSWKFLLRSGRSWKTFAFSSVSPGWTRYGSLCISESGVTSRCAGPRTLLPTAVLPLFGPLKKREASDRIVHFAKAVSSGSLTSFLTNKIWFQKNPGSGQVDMDARFQILYLNLCVHPNDNSERGGDAHVRATQTQTHRASSSLMVHCCSLAG